MFDLQKHIKMTQGGNISDSILSWNYTWLNAITIYPTAMASKTCTKASRFTSLCVNIYTKYKPHNALPCIM